jgi:hypothetical protein
MAAKTYRYTSATMVFRPGLNCLMVETKGFDGKTPLFIGFSASLSGQYFLLYRLYRRIYGERN